MLTVPTRLTTLGHEVDTSPDAFGELVASNDLLDDPPALRQRMDEQGYIFLRGYLDRDHVMAAREEVCRRLVKMGAIDDSRPLMDAIARPGAEAFFKPNDITVGNEPLMTLLYSGRMIAFYELLLGGSVRHFDYTWFRSQGPDAKGTSPHRDVVYMGRGSQRLHTTWTPIGDVGLDEGPLMIMPRSHRIDKLRENYGKIDVDAVCSNRTDADGKPKLQSPTFGALSRNPVRLRRNLGLPWLTTEFKAGDMLAFTIHTIHCSLDNRSQRIRLSSDSRYQPADEPADERWISIDGKPPVTHGENAHREMIC
jgi:ectoine hydroxylase-related dioxygenase (phytanoyl-CoA dioxygenase family)